MTRLSFSQAAPNGPRRAGRAAACAALALALIASACGSGGDTGGTAPAASPQSAATEPAAAVPTSGPTSGPAPVPVPVPTVPAERSAEQGPGRSDYAGVNCDTSVTGVEGAVPVDFDGDGFDDTCGVPFSAGLNMAGFAPQHARIVSDGFGVSGRSQSPSASEPATAEAVRCFGHHRFGEYPVDVAKTADGQTVIAQAIWGWHDSIGCYLALDDGALAGLRAAPAPRDLPGAPTDVSRRCFEFHKFGESPVDAAKTADGQTVIARLSWGWHDSIGCYLVLDSAAIATLRAAAVRALLPDPGWYPDPACRHERRAWDGRAWTGRVSDLGAESSDPIRPGEADSLALPGADFICSAADPVVAVAGWKPDPTCRYEYRWWEDMRWTVHAVDRGEDEQRDFLRVGDGHLPLPSPPVDCADGGEPSYAFPCGNPAPSGESGVGIGGDGLPCATKLPEMGDPLFWNSGWHEDYGMWDKAQTDDYWYKHEGISDEEALGYITACVRGGAATGGGDAYPDSYPTYGHDPDFGPTRPDPPRVDGHLSVFQECADTWSKSAHAINFGGMRNSAACVYDTYLDYHFRHTSDGVRYEYLRYDGTIGHLTGVGWAWECGSWVDPVPDRSFVEKCVWLRGHYIGHDEAQLREAADSKCADVSGYTLSAERLTNVCTHRYALVLMARGLFNREANLLRLGFPPDEYLPEYGARFPYLGIC